MNSVERRMPSPRKELIKSGYVEMKSVEKIKPILREMLAESGWVDGPKNKGTLLFSTPLLKGALPKKGSLQWLDNEIFVFEIVNFKTPYFITKVFPGDENTRDLLFKALSRLDCIYKPATKEPWINHTWHRMSFAEKDFIGKSKDEIKEMLKADWDKITGIVNKVETELLKSKAALKSPQMNKANQKPHWHRLSQPITQSTNGRQQPKRKLPLPAAA